MFENYFDVKTSIDKEGIGYFILDYVEPEDMPDEKGKELFKKTKEALVEFENYVNTEAKKVTE